MSEYRQERRDKLAGQHIDAGQGPGPVELGVHEEIAGAAEARPGLAGAAVCLAQLLDNPQGRNQYAAAAKVLVSVLDKLCSDSARHRRGGLALVRTMTERGT